MLTKNSVVQSKPYLLSVAVFAVQHRHWQGGPNNAKLQVAATVNTVSRCNAARLKAQPEFTYRPVQRLVTKQSPFFLSRNKQAGLSKPASCASLAEVDSICKHCTADQTAPVAIHSLSSLRDRKSKVAVLL